MNQFKHKELRCGCTHNWEDDYDRCHMRKVGKLHLLEESECKKCGLSFWTIEEGNNESIQA